MHRINGILIPGGDGDLADSGYRRISEAAIKYSRRLAKKGIPFPVLGICRGSQMMIQLVTEEDPLDATDSMNITMPLIFTEEITRSQLFKNAPKDLIRLLERKPVTFNAHVNSVTVAKFNSIGKLKKQFRIVSTNYDRRGIEFISTFEGRLYTFKIIQWNNLY